MSRWGGPDGPPEKLLTSLSRRELEGLIAAAQRNREAFRVVLVMELN